MITNFNMTKDLKDKAILIKNKSYVQVKDRILALAEEGKYSIETDYEYFADRKMWVVKAKLSYNGQVYTGLAQEVESDNYKEVNHSSALENAETSAVGRACAMAGIGVLDSIASVDEINKANNRPQTNYAPVDTSDMVKLKTNWITDPVKRKEQNDKIKAVGGKWNADEKSWYLPRNVTLNEHE